MRGHPFRLLEHLEKALPIVHTPGQRRQRWTESGGAKHHAEIVVQDAESYRKLVARLERAEAVIAIREGLLDADAGRVHPARKALAELGMD